MPIPSVEDWETNIWKLQQERAKLREQLAVLLEIAQEIAGDSRCDLCDSERRIRLYAAISKGGGTL